MNRALRLVKQQLRLVFDRVMEFKELGIFIPFLILFLGVGITHPVFFGLASLTNVARHTSLILPIAFMMTLVMVTGGIDISVGRLTSFCGIMAGLVLVNGDPIPLGILTGLATGALFGFLNGFIISTLHIPPIIVTLGMMYITWGIGLVITAGNPLYPFPKSYLFLGQGRLLGIPVTVWVAAAVGIVAWILLYKMPYGYWLSALGGNREAARRAGLRLKPLEISAYVLSGLACGIAGMVFSARCSSAKPDLTAGWEMEAIAATVIGGTSLFGGTGSILGTLIGATIMSMLTSILVILKIQAYWQNIVVGCIVILAVGFDVYRRRIKYVPGRIKTTWDKMSDIVERPNLDLLLKGAGLSRESLSSVYSGNGKPVLELKGITKYFGYVQALDRVDFELYLGEVIALVGDNGAGKSTLVKIASGALLPDGGEIFLRGEKVEFKGPRDAMDQGIVMLYQDLALVDCRDVPSNLFLGREPRRLGGLLADQKRMEEGSKMMLEGLRINLPSVKTPVQYLSGGQRQGIAVGRAVSQGASAIILDEPTAALGVRESRQVLSLIEELREAGCSVVVISHNLAHVFSVADRIVVLRGGRRVGSWRKDETTAEEIVAAITGAAMLESIHEPA